VWRNRRSYLHLSFLWQNIALRQINVRSFAAAQIHGRSTLSLVWLDSSQVKYYLSNHTGFYTVILV
jgi:hypothetical protein